MLFIALFGIRWNQVKDTVFVLPRPSLIFFHVIYVVIVVLVAVPSLGLSGATELAPHSALMHGVVTGLALLMMLMYRSKRIQQKSLIDVAIAHQEALIEKKQREEQGHFLEMLTHEFKTSLAVLRMAIGTAKLGSKEAAYAEQAIQGMNDVIERCGQVQALADQKISIEWTKCHLNKLLGEVIERSRSPKDVVLECDPALIIKSDLKLLKIIFANLIDNAIKYSNSGGRVVISLITENDSLRVSIKDTGIGIDEKDLTMVTNQFYRAPNAAQKVSAGSGIGLYICKRIIEGHKGSINIESKLGSGTTITVNLPIPKN
jgi:signal transduction histidine kinase